MREMNTGSGSEGLAFQSAALNALAVLLKRRLLVAAVTAAGTLAAAAFLYFQENIFQSTAVISPVSAKDSVSQGLSSMAMQFGNFGMTLPGSPSSSEIVNLLRSRIVREKLIRRYDLLPVLFRERWNEPQKKWLDRKPDVWDGLRRLNSVISISNLIKDNMIVISVETGRPEDSANIAGFLLDTLTDHMTGEARRVAEQNRRYLEAQLSSVSDPLIRQKVYNLMAQQIETAMMSEVKENFAFKVIDPPKIPDRKSRPEKKKITILCFAASFLGASLLAYALEFLKNSRIP